MLKGAKRNLGTSQSCKLPITHEILLDIKSRLDLDTHNNKVFWAACFLVLFLVFETD